MEDKINTSVGVPTIKKSDQDILRQLQEVRDKCNRVILLT